MPKSTYLQKVFSKCGIIEKGFSFFFRGGGGVLFHGMPQCYCFPCRSTADDTTYRIYWRRNVCHSSCSSRIHEIMMSKFVGARAPLLRVRETNGWHRALKCVAEGKDTQRVNLNEFVWVSQAMSAPFSEHRAHTQTHTQSQALALCAVVSIVWPRRSLWKLIVAISYLNGTFSSTETVDWHAKRVYAPTRMSQSPK